MRVLEAFGEPISYGGQESFVMNVLGNMDRSGIAVDLLSPYYCDNLGIASKMSEYGGSVYTLECDFRPGALRNRAAKSIRSFLRTHESYDVIHIHSGSNSMLAMFARIASECGIPRIIVHSHCTGKKGLKHSLSKMATEGILRKYPTAYCACSREAGEWRFPADVCQCDGASDLNETKYFQGLQIINNGIDIERFRYNEKVRNIMRERLGIGDDTVLVGCVGRLTHQKNQGFLLELLHEIRKESMALRNYKLILVGEGEDRFALEKKAAELGLTERFIFTGAVNNVEDYLQAMDIVVLPSRYEGLGMSSIEAQAAGLDVIASDAVPTSAAVTDGITFIPLNAPELWMAEIIKEHNRHPERAKEVSENGYSAAETARKLRRLYIEGVDET